MENQSSSDDSTDLINICEFEPSFMPRFPLAWMNLDIRQAILQADENHRKIREQLPRGPNYSMRSEVVRLKKTLLDLAPMSTWSPAELSAAGFYATGLEDSSQCFCCGLVLCKQSLSKTPMENHRKFSPNCGFIQRVDSGNISRYDIRLQPSDDGLLNKDLMESEEKRLQSFTHWPVYSLIEPALLAQAGFFFIGRRDHVQCFSCSGCLGNWSENDDPWKEHAKWFPECAFLRNMKSEGEIRQYIQHYWGFAGFNGASFANISDTENMRDKLASKNTIFHHFEEVKFLNKELITTYNETTFRNSSPFGDYSEMHIDLKSLFADISVVLKDTRNQPVQQLTLPDILSILSDITMVEGEAGSGKTALLRKIAILWASGTCPILSRFSLVFYISVSSIKNPKEMLSDIINKQLALNKTSLTEEILWKIINHLGNQILFLVDDYSEMDLIPEKIKNLLEQNPANRMSVAVSVRTSMGRKLRHMSRTVLRIQEFPLYSTLYLTKNMFSCDMEWLKSFLVILELSKGLQATLQTPLVTLALCSYKVQFPDATRVSDTHVFKAYLTYHIQKFPMHLEKVKDLVSSCGELALRGLFQSCFEFTDEDLSQAGIDGDEIIHFGLLCKFTAQRLRPKFKFFHPSFQEFLAGKRLSELLESDEQDILDKGLHYLKYIDTFLKMVGRYHYLLKYALRNSAKATLNILSYLFSLYDSAKALDCHVDSNEHLQRHPELDIPEHVLIYSINGLFDLNLESLKSNLLLNLAVEAGIESQFLSACTSKIMEFIKSKMFSYTLNPFSSDSEHSMFLFIQRYPECISLMRCFQINISPNNPHTLPDFSAMSNIPKTHGIPLIEREYSSSYLHLKDVMEDKQKKINETNQVLSLFPQEIRIGDALIRAFSSLRSHKLPFLKIQATSVNIANFAESNCEKMKVLFSISDHIELTLNICSAFVQNNRSAIEGNLSSFSGCIIQDTELSAEEQGLILKMSSLEYLHLGSTRETPPAGTKALSYFVYN
ncbi:baculoviral IAP repeat-containing protein 1-like [Pelobates fuscus]|uniref:baculoviral IAP repeat-containing protein 1-like n=1 Tax=Pelobates fuscus TaxID=191477 RepID=UPI002FE44BEC